MSTIVLLALIGGTIARIPALWIQSKRRDIKIWKIFPLTVLLTVAEFAGTMVLFWVESGGRWGGMSYYGGILLMPLYSILLALVLRIRYSDFMDLCGVSAGGMLAVMRLQCVYYQCCKGIDVTIFGKTFAFPSPIVELLTVLAIMVALLLVGNQERFQGKLFPMYLILYGVTRFGLNWFRANNSPFVFNLPHGNFWSLVAITIGVVWLLLVRKTKTAKA